MEQIAQKICIYQIKVVPLHTVFIFEFGFMVISAPLAAIARGVSLSIWLKRLSILRKINFFLKKKWKNLVVSKKCCTFAPSNNKNIYNNEKENYF